MSITTKEKTYSPVLIVKHVQGILDPIAREQHCIFCGRNLMRPDMPFDWRDDDYVYELMCLLHGKYVPTNFFQPESEKDLDQFEKHFGHVQYYSCQEVPTCF